MTQRRFMMRLSLLFIRAEAVRGRPYGGQARFESLVFLAKVPALLLSLSILLFFPMAKAQTVGSPVDEGCVPEGAIVSSAKSLPLPALKLDHSCWVDYAEAQRLSPVWVDVRSLPEKRMASLPGALQIPLSQVFIKSFLKDNPVVLIGNGIDDAEMAVACHRLKEGGFSQLRILRHGMRGWYRAGQPLQGEATILMALDTIDASHFFRGWVAQTWRVIGVGLPDSAYEMQSGAISLGEIAERIEVADETQAGSEIQALLQTSHGTRKVQAPSSAYTPTTIIIAPDEAMTQRLRKAVGKRVREMTNESALWLAGGWQGYLAFVEQQQRIAAVAANPPPLRRPCGS